MQQSVGASAVLHRREEQARKRPLSNGRHPRSDLRHVIELHHLPLVLKEQSGRLRRHILHSIVLCNVLHVTARVSRVRCEHCCEDLGALARHPTVTSASPMIPLQYGKSVLEHRRLVQCQMHILWTSHLTADLPPGTQSSPFHSRGTAWSWNLGRCYRRWNL